MGLSGQFRPVVSFHSTTSFSKTLSPRFRMKATRKRGSRQPFLFPLEGPSCKVALLEGGKEEYPPNSSAVSDESRLRLSTMAKCAYVTVLALALWRKRKEAAEGAVGALKRRRFQNSCETIKWKTQNCSEMETCLIPLFFFSTLTKKECHDPRVRCKSALQSDFIETGGEVFPTRVWSEWLLFLSTYSQPGGYI